MRVKIIKGYYGYNNGHSIRPIGIGQTVDVSNSEADRLVGLGIASLIKEETQTETLTKTEVKEPTAVKRTRNTRKKEK